MRKRPIYDSYTTERNIIERRRLVGPYADGKTVMQALHADGWRITRSGPYTNLKMFPDVDASRFLFIAERETKEKA
jgi:hypothetical protein